jgi:hypothetical protein
MFYQLKTSKNMRFSKSLVFAAFFLVLLSQYSCSSSQKNEVNPKVKVSDTVFCVYKPKELRGQEIKSQRGVLMYGQEIDYDIPLREAWVININTDQDKILSIENYPLSEQIAYGENLLLVCKDQFPPDIRKMIDEDPNAKYKIYEVNVSGFKRGENNQFKFNWLRWFYIGYKFEITDMKFIPQVPVNPCFINETAKKEYVELLRVAPDEVHTYFINQNPLIIMDAFDRIIGTEKRAAYGENLMFVCLDDFPKDYRKAIETSSGAFFNIKGYKRGNNDFYPLFSSTFTKYGYKLEITSIELAPPHIEPTLCSFSSLETRGEQIAEKEGLMYSLSEKELADERPRSFKFLRTGMMVNLNGDSKEQFYEKFSKLQGEELAKYLENILFICEDKLPHDIRLKKQSKIQISGYKRGNNKAFKYNFNNYYFGYKFEVTKIEILE